MTYSNMTLLAISMFLPILQAHAAEPQMVTGSGTAITYSSDGCGRQVVSAEAVEKAKAAADQDAAQACQAIGGTSVMAIRQTEFSVQSVCRFSGPCGLSKRETTATAVFECVNESGP